MTRWFWALAAAALAAASLVGDGSSATRSDTGGQFVITQTVVPLFVKQNGPRGTRKIYWAGHPVFPVTVYETGICPESVNCGPRNAVGFGTPPAKTVFPKRANPLVSPRFYYCNGSLTSNYVIGVEYWLIDAKGHRTPIAKNFWVCKTH